MLTKLFNWLILEGDVTEPIKKDFFYHLEQNWKTYTVLAIVFVVLSIVTFIVIGVMLNRKRDKRRVRKYY